MLQTGLKHIQTDQEYEDVIKSNENTVICCGRMGPMCLPVYDIMEGLQDRYDNVAFRDMDFDTSVSSHIKRLPEVRGFTGLPFTIYYKNGKVVRALSSILTKHQMVEALDSVGVSKD